MNLIAASFLSTPSRPHVGGPVRSLVGGVLRWLHAWGDRRHLHALPDHLLRDMGFSRDQIVDVFKGAVHRP